ncbi:jg18911 [Pararge aegeria aegeria]|uniref:Jg18911 protein n=1 Tax=Pararge aegeria aegeria TaxID=348720 RepID=A0A8S4QSR5_9NEOP|nr:jg18911 [Pararge aegeria aegeria]
MKILFNHGAARAGELGKGRPRTRNDVAGNRLASRDGGVVRRRTASRTLGSMETITVTSGPAPRASVAAAPARRRPTSCGHEHETIRRTFSVHLRRLIRTTLEYI